MRLKMYLIFKHIPCGHTFSLLSEFSDGVLRAHHTLLICCATVRRDCGRGNEQQQNRKKINTWQMDTISRVSLTSWHSSCVLLSFTIPPPPFNKLETRAVISPTTECYSYRWNILKYFIQYWIIKYVFLSENCQVSYLEITLSYY